MCITMLKLILVTYNIKVNDAKQHMVCTVKC